jgi:hypothetical protein
LVCKGVLNCKALPVWTPEGSFVVIMIPQISRLVKGFLKFFSCFPAKLNPLNIEHFLTKIFAEPLEK